MSSFEGISHSGPDSVHALAADIRGGSLEKIISAKTLKLYKEAVAFYFRQAIDSDVLPEDEDPALSMIRTIEDAPRTIYMLRALYAAILEKKRGGQTQTPVLEAGCGSGFLAVLARLLDTDTRVTAVDIQEPCIEVTRAFAKTLGVSIEVLRGDIKKMHLDGSRAVIISEHLSSGAQEEHTDLVRFIEGVDPRYVIPFGIQPVVIMSDGDLTVGIEGASIALGDRNASPLFRVARTVTLHGGLHPLGTAINIRWSGPQPALQQHWTEFWEGSTSSNLYHHHLLAPRDLAVSRYINPHLKWAIQVDCEPNKNVPVTFEVCYRLGTLSPSTMGSSTVTVSAPGNRAKAEVFEDDF